MSRKRGNKVDISGLMAKPVAGWENAVQALAIPEHFGVDLWVQPGVLAQLTRKQQDRLAWKLELVTFAAQCMAAGMLKGTLKYAHDAYSVDQWMAHLLGEGADQMNYQLLLAKAYNKRRKGP